MNTLYWHKRSIVSGERSKVVYNTCMLKTLLALQREGERPKTKKKSNGHVVLTYRGSLAGWKKSWVKRYGEHKNKTNKQNKQTNKPETHTHTAFENIGSMKDLQFQSLHEC